MGPPISGQLGPCRPAWELEAIRTRRAALVLPPPMPGLENEFHIVSDGTRSVQRHFNAWPRAHFFILIKLQMKALMKVLASLCWLVRRPAHIACFDIADQHKKCLAEKCGPWAPCHQGGEFYLKAIPFRNT